MDITTAPKAIIDEILKIQSVWNTVIENLNGAQWRTIFTEERHKPSKECATFLMFLIHVDMWYHIFRNYDFTVEECEKILKALEFPEDGRIAKAFGMIISFQSPSEELIRKYENVIEKFTKSNSGWQEFFYNKKVTEKLKQKFAWKYQMGYAHHYFAKYYDGRPSAGYEKDGVFFFDNGDCEFVENVEFLDDMPIEEFIKLCDDFAEKDPEKIKKVETVKVEGIFL